MSRPKHPADAQAWIEARARHHLSHTHVPMARELGMNPRKLRMIDKHRREPWKAPLPEFIAELYRERFGRTAPPSVLPLEQRARSIAAKKAARKALNRARGEAE